MLTTILMVINIRLGLNAVHGVQFALESNCDPMTQITFRGDTGHNGLTESDF